MFDKPSPFDTVHAPKFSSLLPKGFFSSLELSMALMFFAVYTESIGLMENTFLSELPIIGQAFMYIDPDANASHLISILLAIFSVGTPLFIWSEIFRNGILDNPREWISHPQNQVIASFAALVLLLVISLECVSLYSLIAKETIPSPFPPGAQGSDLMDYLAKNKGLAIDISIVIATINIILGLFTAKAFQNLKTSEGDMK